MTDTEQVILAIESAICGGSISLLKNGREIANWIGTSNVSKAEDLLVNIDALLTANNISRHEIDLIAVSAGPGSFTGIRIGLATALGLKAGLGIKMSSESALKAMVYATTAAQHVIAAVPAGRNSVCLQKFQIIENEVTTLDQPRTLTDEHFFEFVRDEKDTNFMLHSSLFEKCNPSQKILNFGANIAQSIGKVCTRHPGHVTEPLFISKSF